MSVWKPISKKPPAPIGVELFYGNLKMTDQDGNVCSPLLEPYRDCRRELGYFDGRNWCEQGTGHDVFEDWRTADQLPTHWRALPEPPH